LANLCGRADLTDRCAGEIKRGYRDFTNNPIYDIQTKSACCGCGRLPSF